MSVFTKIFGTHSEREVKRIIPIVDKIEALAPEFEKLTDEQLQAKTPEFKERLANGETLDDILPEAYATVREAATRVLDMRHYRVQLIGGVILHQGRITEMRTGEGKTLVSTLPAYLNALEGKGVHIVTVNDYLAKRDAEWMGKVHEFLGLTVGVILNNMDNDERREAYNCDITYATNNELGFDYLRDNMAIYKEQMVLRDLDYAIIDEVDSVLIDEARTPLIISGQSGKSTKLYEVCDILARQLQRGEASGEMTKMTAIMGEEIIETGDFIVNEKDKVVNLTEEGVKKVEKFFHIENLADPENLEIQHNIILALRAHNLMFRDQDYVVKDDQVLIVDEFTGRIMPGRRYSDGLHQAIEAKEHVKVRRESKTLATITFQNFFNKYAKKAGMTGTALTEEQEFREIYGMDVIVIPTNRPVIRKDLNDAVYKTKKEKKEYEKKMNAIRGNDISMIFQDPMSYLNPIVTIEKQMTEGIRAHDKCSKQEARERAIELMKMVGIPAPESRLKQYPFEFSGGMRQRIIIAIALACNPKLIVADEPTTALDVTVQAQILDLLRKITEESDAGVIIITHDLGVVASLCDRISIMYGGNIMEEGTTDEIFYDPKHPYTKGLLNSIANSNADHREPLKPIPGTPPDLLKLGDQCPFASRCSEAMEICTKATPLVTEFGETHKCKCWLHCKERWQEVMKGEDAHE